MHSSAVNAGYLHDPFASLIAKAPSSSTTRRVPLINVGTHHRTWALDKLVDSFLESGDKDKQRQIVSLGAGSDTRFWRLMVSCLAYLLSCILILSSPSSPYNMR